jgi:hypothetical protein
VSGKLTVLNGTQKSEAELKPAGGSKLEAAGIKVLPGAKGSPVSRALKVRRRPFGSASSDPDGPVAGWLLPLSILSAWHQLHRNTGCELNRLPQDGWVDSSVRYEMRGKAITALFMCCDIERIVFQKNKKSALLIGRPARPVSALSNGL